MSQRQISLKQLQKSYKARKLEKKKCYKNAKQLPPLQVGKNVSFQTKSVLQPAKLTIIPYPPRSYTITIPVVQANKRNRICLNKMKEATGSLFLEAIQDATGSVPVLAEVMCVALITDNEKYPEQQTQTPDDGSTVVADQATAERFGEQKVAM